MQRLPKERGVEASRFTLTILGMGFNSNARFKLQIRQECFVALLLLCSLGATRRSHWHQSKINQSHDPIIRTKFMCLPVAYTFTHPLSIKPSHGYVPWRTHGDVSR